MSEYEAVISETIGVNRSRSTAEESGHFALYMESLGLIAFYHFSSKIRHNVVKYFFAGILLGGYFFTFSVGGVFSVLISLLVYLLFSLRKTFRIKIIFGLILTFLLVYFLSMNNIFLDKIQSSSLLIRQERFFEGMEVFNKSTLINQMFGFGPAAYDRLKIDPLINLYQVILIENGICGLTVFLIFIILQIRQAIFILQFNAALGKVYFISLVSVFVHFNFVHNYWYPFIWLLFVFNTIDYRNIKKSMDV